MKQPIRGISVATFNKYHVQHGSTGELLFPYDDRRNKQLAALKQRFAPFAPNADKVMPILGSMSNTSLFGHGAVSSPVLILCFGEFDAMSAHEMTGYAAECAVDDIHALMHVSNNLAAFEEFKQIYIVPDNDEMGKKALNDMLEILDLEKVKVVTLPDNVKDVNDMLVQNREAEFKKCLWAGVVPQLPFLRVMEDVTAETLKLLDNVDNFCGYPTGIYELDRALYGGIRPGELLVIGGKSSMGKSSLARALAYRLSENRKVLFCGYEGRQTVDNLLFASLHYKVDIRDKVIRGKLPEARELIEAWGEVSTLTYVNTKVKDLASLLRNLKVAVRMKGFEVIVIDHLQYLINAIQHEGKYIKETQVYEDFMLSLHELTVEMNVAVILVTHVRRNLDSKGQEREEVDIEQFHGSSAIEKFADVCITISGERYNPNVRLKIAKNRLFGRSGDISLTYLQHGDYQ